MIEGVQGKIRIRVLEYNKMNGGIDDECGDDDGVDID
jgi:hypothetical protein